MWWTRKVIVLFCDYNGLQYLWKMTRMPNMLGNLACTNRNSDFFQMGILPERAIFGRSAQQIRIRVRKCTAFQMSRQAEGWESIPSCSQLFSSCSNHRSLRSAGMCLVGSVLWLVLPNMRILYVHGHSIQPFSGVIIFTDFTFTFVNDGIWLWINAINAYRYNLLGDAYTFTSYFDDRRTGFWHLLTPIFGIWGFPARHMGTPSSLDDV